MDRHRILTVVALAGALALAAGGGARAHDPGEERGMMGPGMMGPGTMGPGTMGPGTMGPGMMGPGMMGPGTMGPGMMGPGTMGPGMMGPGMMSPGMMGYGMMGPGMMGYGMMGRGAMHRHGYQGWSGQGIGPGWIYGLPGANVRDLSAEDVRTMLQRSLDWHGNKRLKLGKVEAKDDDTVVADIVTVDDSLVQRLEIDRHSGAMRQVP